MYGSLFKAAMQWQAAAIATTQVGVSAAAVIQMRMMQMSLGIMKPEEAVRMVFEKPAAHMRAAELTARAMAANKSLAAATAAGMAPYRSATRSNARRLRKSGGTGRKTRH